MKEGEKSILTDGRLQEEGQRRAMGPSCFFKLISLILFFLIFDDLKKNSYTVT